MLTSRAQILGTGINSSGALAPANAPVAVAQEEAMRRAFAQAKRSPQDVDFVELHATGMYIRTILKYMTDVNIGTSRGDPTEANWVGAACGRKDTLLVGSLKGNMGYISKVLQLLSI